MIAGFKTRAVADDHLLAELVPALQRRGYEVIGPKVRDGAIVYSLLESAEELPKGFADRQEPGSYRLERRQGAGWFGYHPGPQSIKQFVHPADLRLFSPDAAPRYAFVGIRACELAAIRIQDRTLVEDRYSDPAYEARRRDLFLVAVNCTTTSPDCFCESMQCGPRVESGFDLALTELDGDGRHLFALEAGTARGAEVLEELSGRIPFTDDDPGQLDQAVERTLDRTRRNLTRRVDTSGLHQLLQDNFDHPQWDSVAQRCLSCANCTMVCPTCFCTTVEDTSDVAGDHAGRLRKWDSCFTQSFSYIHGGSVRSSAKSRYRQWLTHKFSYWMDQFGTFGCVGCGRCITWCPAGIDLTAELGAIRETAVLRPPPAKEDLYGNAGTYSGRT